MVGSIDSWRRSCWSVCLRWFSVGSTNGGLWLSLVGNWWRPRIDVWISNHRLLELFLDHEFFRWIWIAHQHTKLVLVVGCFQSSHEPQGRQQAGTGQDSQELKDAYRPDDSSSWLMTALQRVPWTACSCAVASHGGCSMCRVSGQRLHGVPLFLHFSQRIDSRPLTTHNIHLPPFACSAMLLVESLRIGNRSTWQLVPLGRCDDQ